MNPRPFFLILIPLKWFYLWPIQARHLYLVSMKRTPWTRWVTSFAPLNCPKKIRQITLSSNKKTLAYTTDAGTVGIVDLSTKKPFNMKVKHANVSLSSALTTDVGNSTDFLGCEIHPRPTEWDGEWGIWLCPPPFRLCSRQPALQIWLQWEFHIIPHPVYSSINVAQLPLRQNQAYHSPPHSSCRWPCLRRVS